MKSIITFLIVILFIKVSAQPGWVAESGNQFTMGIHAKVELDGVLLSSAGSQLGAFKDGKCWGVCTIFNGPAGMQFQLSVGYIAESATNFELKVWNASTNEILNANEKFNFQNDGGLGSISTPIIYTVTSTCNLLLSESSVEFTSSVGNKSLNVTSNASWTVSDDANWITVTPASGSNNGSLSISVTANTGTERTGTITVTGCSTTKTITVKQESTCSLSLSQNNLEFTSSAGNKSVTVTSNSSWTVSDDAAWITVTPTSGSNNGSLSISVTANTGTERTGTITVTGCSTTKTITVKQESTCSLSLSQNNLEFTSSAGNKSVTVTSNSSWTVSDDAAWITVTPTSGSNNGSLSISVTANTGTERTGTITVTGCSTTKTITVKQESTCSLSLSQNNLEFTSSAGNKSVTVTSNSSWTVSDDAAWITVTPTSGSNNGSISISVTANTGTERTGTITVTGCSAKKTITITQTSTCSLLLSASRLDFKISAGNKSVTVTSNSSWSVVDDAPWITVSPSSGSNNSSLSVSVTANTGAERRGTVTVSCGGVTKQITVIQEAYCTPPWSPTSVSATQTSISSGQTIILSINGGLLNSATEWEWYTGGCGITKIGSGESLTVNPTKTTTYYVQAKACDDSTICRSVTINVSTVNPNTDDFYIQNASLSTTILEPGGAVEVYCDQCYTGSKTDSNMGNVFVGYFLSDTPGFNPATAIPLGTDGSSLGIDEPCDSEDDKLTIPANTAPGTYYILFVADYSGIFEESNESNNIAYQLIQSKSTAIGDILVQGPIKIYPNPTTGIITIEGLLENEIVEVAIYDINRKLIKKQSATSSVTKIDISDVVSGTYLLIIDDIADKTFKIIKE